ncbi:transposase [Streptomyces minutiscleroticus]|uniref:transposase n=1 Tax=Streptomyces minutiscleroticus TaxID=68238 RepID=UPI00331AC502
MHTRLKAGARSSARERGKSDPLDAQTVARAALREPDLSRAALEGPAREVKLLSDHRSQLVQQRITTANRLLWFLHELDPELGMPARGTKRIRVFDAIELALSEHTGTVADIAGDLLADCCSLPRHIDDLQKRLRTLVRRPAPGLLDIPGCGVLSAATVIAETAGASRFTSKAAYARFNGTAPIPVWSSNEVKVRLNRGGNRRIAHALHMIAITQIGRGYAGAGYYAERIARGKTSNEPHRVR